MSLNTRGLPALFLLACLLLLIASGASAAILANEKHTILSLLLSGNHEDYRTAGMIVASEKLTDPEIDDLAAERLIQLATHPADSGQIKTAIYLARTFGSLGLPRYRAVLEQSLQDSTSKDLKQELQDALNQVSAGNAPAYQTGAVSIEAYRAEVAAVSERNRQQFAGQPRQLPAPGQSMDQVYARIGLPDEVLSLDIRYTRLGNVKALYYGLGIVQFDYPRDGAQVLQVFETMPEAPGAIERYAGPNRQFAHALASADEKYFRYLVKGGWQLVRSDPALIEVLYGKLDSLAPTRNKYALDGMTYTLKRLAQLHPAGWNAFLKQLQPRLVDKSAAKLVQRLDARP